MKGDAYVTNVRNSLKQQKLPAFSVDLRVTIMILLHTDMCALCSISLSAVTGYQTALAVVC